MKIRPSLTPKAKLGLSVTQRAMQSIDVLACNLVELGEVVQTHTQRNPFLKVVPKNPQRDTLGLALAEEQNQSLLDTVEQPVGLDAYLDHQLVMAKLGSTQKMLAQLIIKSLDEYGYLRTSLHELAAMAHSTIKQLEQALLTVQSLDPPGIGARNLAECFSLQLTAQKKLTSKFVMLLGRLDDLTTVSRTDLAAYCGVSTHRLAQMLKVLRTLEPHPGKHFVDEVPAYVTPDVIIEVGHDRQLVVRTNDDATPDVYFDQAYFDRVCAQTISPDDKRFMQRCHHEAHNLLNDMAQRGNTITRVARYIADAQQAYFHGKTTLLKPLRQKDLAQHLEVHESTISRVVANKFLLYRGKTIALQDFFGNAAVADDNIESRIKTLIQAETMEKVLSDEDIAQTLKQSGIRVARRTVAKYRTRLNIPSSEQRRHQWVRYL